MFNAEKYVEDCLSSILQQTFSDFEVIIVDDCSTDRSCEVVLEKFSEHPKINLVCRGKNHGNGSARNFGLDLSRGEYVYFMDADDVIVPDTLKILVTAADESGADIVYMNRFYRPVDPDFKLGEPMKIEIWSGMNDKPRFMSEDIIERLRNEVWRLGVVVPQWNKIQRRDFLIDNQIYFPTTLRLEDWLFNFAEICFAKKSRVIDACCYFYRPNPSSQMKEVAEKQLRQAILSLKPCLDYMEETFSKLPEDVPRDFQIEMKTRLMYELLQVFIVRAYRDEVQLQKIDEIMTELSISATTRAVIHTFARVEIMRGSAT